MPLVLFLFVLIFTSCENNPLGSTVFKSCDHSPENKTGLPLTCQVNIPSNDGLMLWLDAHDSGTLTLLDQTDVTDWLDKSGNGARLTKSSGSNLKVDKKSSNDRNSVKFTSLGSYTAGGGLSILPVDSDFSLSLSLKFGTITPSSFEFANGSNFSIAVSQGKELLITMGSQQNIQTGVFLQDGLLYNFIFNYNASSDLLKIIDSGRDISKEIDEIIGAGLWSDVTLIGEELSINEIILYDNSLNELPLKTYLNNKWGF